ncbi:B3 domain-containing protein REM20-like isoform X2 [Ipomoea triloba]|uniref:B3 domain-containing protein REM20-like isoform X2 n=1 Tax=Ipomoea triloba TaxID=35885 RepID=UPI00125E6068|nr:B3 domain-containing protein REM20-like isoform X2 [Ipomoea triloba]
MAGSVRTFRFCKHFCQETGSQKLEIPISFKEYVGGVVPKKNNWANFVEDNSITNGDCLVFSYDGYGMFDCVLFDQFGCEKIVVRDAQSQVNKEVKQEEDDDDDKNDCGDEDDCNFVNEDVKNEVEDDGGSDDEDDSNFVTEEDENEVEEDDDDDDDEEVKTSMFGFTKSKQKRNNSCGFKKCTGASEGEGSSSKKNKNVFDQFGIELFSSGQYIQPKNPYFVTKLRPKDRGALYIPIDVIKDHNIALPPTLILRDTRGREWKSEVKNWKDGRTWLSTGGWQSLCRVNLVDKDDKCICEFVCSNTNDMLLQVTIVRGQTTKNVK